MILLRSFLLSYWIVNALPGTNEVAQLDKYRMLAKMFFKDHEEAFSAAFVHRWIGDGNIDLGRFEKILNILGKL